MNIPTTLTEKVRVLEQEIGKHRDSANQLEIERNETQTQYNSVRSQMNWREKYFVGWLGGDKLVIQKARGLKGLLNDYDTKIDKTKRVTQSTENQINETIKSYLVQNDSVYQQLYNNLEKVAEIRDATSSYIEIIDDALSDIDDAQGMETLDLFTKNKGISILSWMENEEAQEAIDTVKEYTDNFQDALNKYNGFLKNQKSFGIGQIKISDEIDFVFDMIFDGFDFMSLFTLASLNSAESELEELHSKVFEVQKKINEHYQKAEKNVATYIHNVRKACNQ